MLTGKNRSKHLGIAISRMFGCFLRYLKKYGTAIVLSQPVSFNKQFSYTSVKYETVETLPTTRYNLRPRTIKSV